MVLTINHTWSWPQEKPHINVKNKLIDGPAKSLKRFDVRRRDPSSNTSVWALQIFVVYEPSLISPSLHKVRATEVRIIVSKKKVQTKQTQTSVRQERVIKFIVDRICAIIWYRFLFVNYFLKDQKQIHNSLHLSWVDCYIYWSETS